MTLDAYCCRLLRERTRLLARVQEIDSEVISAKSRLGSWDAVMAVEDVLRLQTLGLPKPPGLAALSSTIASLAAPQTMGVDHRRPVLVMTPVAVNNALSEYGDMTARAILDLFNHDRRQYKTIQRWAREGYFLHRNSDGKFSHQPETVAEAVAV